MLPVVVTLLRKYSKSAGLIRSDTYFQSKFWSGATVMPIAVLFELNILLNLIDKPSYHLGFSFTN